MNSIIAHKTPVHLLGLVYAALLLQSNALSAAPVAVDPQTQARDLLSGTFAGQPRTADESRRISAPAQASSVVDAQDQARRLIVGTTTPSADRKAGVAGPGKRDFTESVRGRQHAFSDGQESARRMILGLGGVSRPHLTANAD